jgi:hypothetical protein
MVVGVYSLAYAYVAWKPEQGDILIWVGFIGKVLGPFGWLQAVVVGELPARTFPLTLFNDLIWWFPFLFYLLRRQRFRGRIITGLVVIFHTVACLGLILLREGMELNPSLADRQQWVLDHSFLWAFVWFFWVLSSLSLPAFLAAWIFSLRDKARAPSWTWVAVALAGLGVLFDLSGELLYITWLPAASRTLLEFEWGVRAYSLLSAAAANGLYCMSGLLLSIVSFRLGFLRGPTGSLGFLLWMVGLGLTLAALLDHRLGIIITAAGTMALFIPWAAWVGWRFVREESL